MYFGFENSHNKYKEYVPSIFQPLSKYELYCTFISQYNAHVKSEFRISPLHVKGCDTLFEVFKNKINSLLEDDSIFKCDHSKQVIEQYRSGNFSEIKLIRSTMPTHEAARLIFMIFAKDMSGLLFDARDFFCNYVYDKVQKRHKEKNVLFYDNFMIMEFSKDHRIGILPSFRHMDTHKPYLADDDIKEAFRVIRHHSLNKLFITYPKNVVFRKHMVVRHQVCNARLTLVPYAISNKIVYNSKQNFNKIKEI